MTGEPKPSPPDSLKKRYSVKMVTNILGLGATLAVQMIVPRTLGPGAYGNFSFLTNFFTRLVGFFNMGSTLAFYTKLSQRPREQRLVHFYGWVAAIVVGAVLALVGLARLFPLQKILWPGQEFIFIGAAALWALAVWFTEILHSMTDAYGLTVRAEWLRLGQRILSAFLLVSLWGLGILTLGSFFIYHYVILAVLCFLWIRLIHKAGFPWDGFRLLSRAEIISYGGEFYQYVHPLLTYSLIGFLAAILDRWILQKFGGSTEQGFFGLSFQIGALCFLFTGAMTPLIMREFSIAMQQSNRGEMARLFRRYIPALYSITAVLACFVAVNAEIIVDLFGGSQYRNAAIPMALMAFYPIHQTYGQLSGSIFYATGQMVLYRNIGLVSMMLGLPLTFFLMAPHRFMGLNLGATGLAVKTVAIQLLLVNLQLFFNARYLNLPLGKYVAHQIVVVGAIGGMALAASRLTGLIVLDNSFLSISATGIVYGGMILLAVGLFPKLFGLQRSDVSLFIQGVVRPWKRILS